MFLEVCDLMGRIVWQDVIPAGAGEWVKDVQLTEVIDGWYFVRLRTERGEAVKKVLIRR